MAEAFELGISVLQNLTPSNGDMEVGLAVVNNGIGEREEILSFSRQDHIGTDAALDDKIRNIVDPGDSKDEAIIFFFFFRVPKGCC
jgi:hypothetical protein